MNADKLGKIRLISKNAFEVPLNELSILLRKFSVSPQPFGTIFIEVMFTKQR